MNSGLRDDLKLARYRLIAGSISFLVKEPQHSLSPFQHASNAGLCFQFSKLPVSWVRHCSVHVSPAVHLLDIL